MYCHVHHKTKNKAPGNKTTIQIFQELVIISLVLVFVRVLVVNVVIAVLAHVV